GWPVQTGAELLVEKTVSDSLAVPGQSLTYQVALNNGGPTTLNNVVITDVVPPYTTLNAASLSPDATFSGLEAGSVITWTTNTSLAQGQSLNRSFKVNLTSNAPGGMAITNTAAVAAANLPEPRQSNTVATIVNNVASCGFYDGFEDGQLSDFWDTTVTNQGLVRVVSTITDIDPETHAPHTGNYQVVLEDNIPGGQSSRAALILTLDLVGRTDVNLDFWWHENEDENNPADGVFVSDDYGATWHPALSFNNGPQSWRQDGLDLDALAATYGLAFNNHFQVKFQFEDNADFVNNDGYALDDVQVTCNTQPRLMVAKRVNLAAAPAGTTLNYTIFVTNTTISEADNIVIVDSVPERTTLNPGSLSGDASQGHDLIIWNTGQDLSYNEQLTRTFSVIIDNDVAVGSSVTNSAYGSAANASVVVSNLATTAIITPPDKVLSMAKWVETASTPAQPGEAVTYTLEITNHTFETVSGIQVIDTLPNYIAGSDLNQPVNLPPDTSLTLTIAASLDGSTPTDTIINNIAFYSHTMASGQATAVFNTRDTIAPTMPLTDPNTGSALITPTLGFSVSTHSPRFTWHPATDNIKLAHYTLVMTATAPVSGLVSTFVTATTQTEFSPTWLENGIYSWSIQVHDAAGNVSGFAPPETFVVDLEDVFLPIMLKQ
ncbi:MAG: DUF11 domain-containing protein, partial [Anaerolineae bacterium]|nr:DUF11 domain-containing protein [Anaerolineae bacterium]